MFTMLSGKNDLKVEINHFQKEFVLHTFYDFCTELLIL